MYIANWTVLKLLKPNNMLLITMIWLLVLISVMIQNYKLISWEITNYYTVLSHKIVSTIMPKLDSGTIGTSVLMNVQLLKNNNYLLRINNSVLLAVKAKVKHNMKVLMLLRSVHKLVEAVNSSTVITLSVLNNVVKMNIRIWLTKMLIDAIKHVIDILLLIRHQLHTHVLLIQEIVHL